MAEVTKYQLIPSNGSLLSEMKSRFSLFKTKRKSIVLFVYGCMFAFVIFTLSLAFSPLNSSSPWFFDIFTSTAAANSSTFDASTSSSILSDESYGSHFSSIFPDFFPGSHRSDRNFSSLAPSGSTNSIPSPPLPASNHPSPTGNVRLNNDQVPSEVNKTNSDALPTTGDIGKEINRAVELPRGPTTSVYSPAGSGAGTVKESGTEAETVASVSTGEKDGSFKSYHGAVQPGTSPQTEEDVREKIKINRTAAAEKEKNRKAVAGGNNSTVPSLSVKNGSYKAKAAASRKKQGKENNLIDRLVRCDLYDGGWVRDDSYPLYEPGSCSLIDEQFNCPLNGRPDMGYLELKWQPKACTLPRLNGGHMLELLRGKRLVFVGDSLNRNMWESLVCVLRNAVQDKSKVYEAYGRQQFRTEASYSFVFRDYNCTIEFFASPFLVRQWEVKDKDGETKETLRLDLIAESADEFKGADILVFNTGHWWTHEKTSKGQEYYQEGSHVYGELDVVEAFRRAITTWGMWIDANVNRSRTHVLYRGYSASHFSGGQWNSGGACDSETEPIKKEAYLSPYPWKMKVFEKVVRGMRTPVSYLNVTRLTDFRKDGHPSVYRKRRFSDEEKRAPLKYQDCSHWCLPGVPDAWNELLYAEILRKEQRYEEEEQQGQKRT